MTNGVHCMGTTTERIFSLESLVSTSELSKKASGENFVSAEKISVESPPSIFVTCNVRVSNWLSRGKRRFTSAANVGKIPGGGPLKLSSEA